MRQVRRHWDAAQLSEEDKKQAILDHIGETVSDELFVRGMLGKTASEILSTLLLVYSKARSVGELEGEFFAVNQGPGQTIGEYAAQLLRAYRALTKRQAEVKEHLCSDRALRDRFASGLEARVRMRAREYIQDHPNVSFVNLRGKCLQWETMMEEVQAASLRVTELPVKTAKLPAMQASVPAIQAPVPGIEETLTALTAQLNSLVGQVADLKRDRDCGGGGKSGNARPQ